MNSNIFNKVMHNNQDIQRMQQSSAFLRKRKMMLMLPFLIFPFVTMVFWALGGGKTTVPKDSINNLSLNLNLPPANIKEDGLTDKLGFYEKADRDSIKKEESMRNDPYYMDKKDTVHFFKNELEQLTENTASKYKQHLNTSPYDVSGNNPEQKIMQKIAVLETEMNKQPEQKKDYAQRKGLPNQNDDFSNEIDRLENLIQDANGAGGADPEVQQLNGTLDKILDIQHPQRVKDRLREKSLQQQQAVFAVSKYPVEDNVSLLGTKKKAATTGQFYGTEKNLHEDFDNTIGAVVDANQVLINGAIIKLRLNTDIYIDGNLIPKGNCVNGIATLNDERLEIEINSIRKDNSIFPVKLDVYDMDGLQGIYIPGAISRDVAKQSVDNGLQLMELTSMDPSFKTQAATAGINTAKSLLSKKIKQVKVMVKSGYKVLLKDKNLK